MRFSGKCAAVAALALFGSGASSRPASAQWVCTNCSTEVTAALSYANQGRQLVQQLQQYRLQTQQFLNQVQNTISLPRQLWAEVEGDISRVRAATMMGEQLVNGSNFSVGSLNSFAGYLGSGVDMMDRYGSWSRRANDNVGASLRGLGLQQEQMQTDQAVLRSAQSDLAMAEGQKQAQQATGGLVGQNVVETQKVRQALLTIGQTQANQYQLQADQQAAAQAKMASFVFVPDASVAGGARY